MPIRFVILLGFLTVSSVASPAIAQGANFRFVYGFASTPRDIWVSARATVGQIKLLRLDPQTLALTGTVECPGQLCAGPVAVGDEVWLAQTGWPFGEPKLQKVDADRFTLGESFPYGGLMRAFGGHLWLLDRKKSEFIEFDPNEKKVVGRQSFPKTKVPFVNYLPADEGIWIASESHLELKAWDGDSRVVASGLSLDSMTIDGEFLWAGGLVGHDLYQIDRHTLTLEKWPGIGYWSSAPVRDGRYLYTRCSTRFPSSPGFPASSNAWIPMACNGYRCLPT